MSESTIYQQSLKTMPSAVQIMESYRRLLVPVIVTVLCMSLLPSVHGQAIGRQVSPFLFQLDESTVDGKRYSYLTGPGPAAIIKQNETKSLPIIILSATDKPIPVKFHVTVGNNQTGPIQMPLGVHATVEPSDITIKSNQNQTINIIVSADKNAPDGKYALNIVGEWPEENGFVGTSIVINIGKDFGPDTMPFNFQWTPLKQFKSGIDANSIRCKEDLMLVIKSSDGSPACVRPLTYNKLAERGWANLLGSQMTFYVFADGTRYEIPYKTTGWRNKVLNMTADLEAKSFLVTIQTKNNGELTVTLPRALIDAKTGEQDDDFFVLVDGQQSEIQSEKKTDTERTLTISFPAGTEIIEIIGGPLI